MKSFTTLRFRRAFKALPAEIRRQARHAYKLFQADPHHPSLRFKKVHPSEPIYSVRITRDYRVVGVLKGSEVVWFFIGSHAEYEVLLRSL